MGFETTRKNFWEDVFWSWIDGSVDKSTGCSPRESQLDSSIHMMTQNYV